MRHVVGPPGEGYIPWLCVTDEYITPYSSVTRNRGI
jgi:hypothetical protein